MSFRMYFTILSFMAIIIMANGNPICRDLKETELMAMLLSKAKLFKHGNLLLVKIQQANMTEGATTKTPLTGNKKRHHHEPESCPTAASTDAEAPIHKRAVCPWSYVMEEQKDRFPRTIPVAKCKCSNCIGPDPNKTYCSKIYRQIPVLKRHECNAATKFYIYRWKTIKISVACVCTNVRVKQVEAQDVTEN